MGSLGDDLDTEAAGRAPNGTLAEAVQPRSQLLCFGPHPSRLAPRAG
jgi:hypothetical protein